MEKQMNKKDDITKVEKFNVDHVVPRKEIYKNTRNGMIDNEQTMNADHVIASVNLSEKYKTLL